MDRGESLAMTEMMRFVAVRVAEVLVGIPLDRVEEVVRWSNVTAVASAPHGLYGVANLRGNLVTLIDIGEVLQGTEAGHPESGVTVIVSFGNESVGLFADDLEGVFDASECTEQSVTRNALNGSETLIASVLQAEDCLLLKLDIDALLASCL